MKQYRIPHKYIGQLIACLCLGLSASSCVDDVADCIEDRPGYVEGNDVWLSFTLRGEESAPRTVASRTSGEATGSLFSRAGEEGTDDNKHPAEAATEAENAINPAEIRLLLFDNNRNLLKILDSSDIVTISPTDDKDVYEIKAKINRAYFDYAGTQESFYMSLMLVTNLSGFGPGYAFPAAGSLFMNSATWLSQQHYSFPYSPTTDTHVGWYPDGESRFIPMAGLKHYKVTRTALDAATDANDPYKLGGDENPLLLQRSVAKIRVFDHINGANPDARTVITAVSVKGLNSRGAFMPDFSLPGCEKWADGTTMVEKATVETDWFNTGLSAPARMVGPADGGDYTDADGKKFETAFVAYIPEADLRSPDVTSPTLVITAEDTLEGPTQTNTWTFKLSDIIKETGIDITRNHIYEFTVTRSLNAQLTLSYTVCPWITKSVTIPPFD